MQCWPITAFSCKWGWNVVPGLARLGCLELLQLGCENSSSKVELSTDNTNAELKVGGEVTTVLALI